MHPRYSLAEINKWNDVIMIIIFTVNLKTTIIVLLITPCEGSLNFKADIDNSNNTLKYIFHDITFKMVKWQLIMSKNVI